MKKYYIITGKAESGKSTTIDELSKKFKNALIRKFVKKNGVLKFDEMEKNEELINHNYLLYFNEIIILFVAGCPTEQEISITAIIEFLEKENIQISIAIISKRTKEIRLGYNTITELQELKWNKLGEEKINRIDSKEWKNTDEWKNRINRIYNIIIENI